MSIEDRSLDDRLREGLAANTDHLRPSLDVELARVLRRRHRRRQVRAGGAVLVAAAVGGVVLSGVAGIDRSEGPGPSENHGKVDQPKDLDGVRGPLTPGTYLLGVWGEEQGEPHRYVEVQVPAGYFSNGGYVVDAGNSEDDPGEWGEVAVWRVEQIVPDPCDGTVHTDIGPGVRTLDGYSGLYLEVTSTTPDLGRCSYGMHALWHTGNSTDLPYGQDRPGVTNHLWILDVDGERLVVTVSNHPDQTDAVRQGLLDIAATIHFLEP